jgi:Tfp pilus assembly protein PilO
MRCGSIVFVPIIALLLMRCGSGEISRLRSENERLRNALQEYQPDIAAMYSMRAQLDSIDINRNAFRPAMSSVPSAEAVRSRLRDINRYVITSGQELTRFEDDLRLSQKAVSSYKLMIDALKSEIVIRDEEISDLRAALSVYQRANTWLTYNAVRQKDSVDLLGQDLALLEAKISGIITHLRIREGDVMYARGKAAQEAARRAGTKASQKRDAYREALEVYKKAYSLGKQEAMESIEELEWILLTDPELHPLGTNSMF